MLRFKQINKEFNTCPKYLNEKFINDKYFILALCYFPLFNYTMKVIHPQEQHLHANHPVSKYLNPDWNLATQHGLASKIGVANDLSLQFCTCCFHHVHKDPIPMSENTKQLQFLGFGVPLYFAFVRNCMFLLLVTICCYNLPSLYYALTHNKFFCEKNLDMATHMVSPYDHPPPHFHQGFQLQRRFGHVQVKAVKQSNHITNESIQSQVPANVSKATAQQKENIAIAHKIQCTGWMIHLSRIQNKITPEEQLFRCGSFFIHFILLLYIRNKLTKMKYYFDERSVSPSDFAVFIKNMPMQVGQKAAVRAMVRQEYDVPQVRDVILVPDLTKIQQLDNVHQVLLNKLQKKIHKQKQGTSQIESIQAQILHVQRQIDDNVRNFKEAYAADRLEAERAVILFETQNEKWKLINSFQKSPCNRKGWERISMTEASEPNQIIWENACLKSSHKNIFKFLGWYMSILTLLLITAIFALISHFKSLLVEHKIQEYKKSQNKEPHLLNEAFALVMGSIFLVVLFNKFILSHLFHKFTELERHSNTYKFQFYYCLKYCLGLFFTTALMTIIIEDLIFNNYFKHNYGVIEQETIMFLFNSTFVPLFWLINPLFIAKLIKRKMKFGSKFMQQSEANELMEHPPYDIGKRYGQVLEIMWFTFMYISIIPVGGVFSLIGLFFYYWVDKYNLLRRSVIHGQVSGDLINLTLGMLEFTLVLRIAGEIMFDYQLRGGPPLISWACLAIAVGYILLPAEIIVNLFDHQIFLNQKLTYTQSQIYFKNTYYTVHLLFNRLQQDRQSILKQKIRKKSQKNQLFGQQKKIEQQNADKKEALIRNNY